MTTTENDIREYAGVLRKAIERPGDTADDKLRNAALMFLVETVVVDLHRIADALEAIKLRLSASSL